MLTWQFHWLHEVVKDKLRKHSEAVVVLEESELRLGRLGRL